MPLKLVYSERRRKPRHRVEFLTVGAENGKGLFRDFPSPDAAAWFADQIREQFDAAGVPVDVRTVPI